MPDETKVTAASHNDRCASLLGQGCDCRSPWWIGPPEQDDLGDTLVDRDHFEANP